MGSRTEPLIQGEVFPNLLQHLDTRKFMGITGSPKDVREVLTVPLSIIFLLGRSQVTAGSQMGQEGLEGGFRQLRAGQPELGAMEQLILDARKTREQSQPVRAGHRQSLPDHPPLLPWQQDLLGE